MLYWLLKKNNQVTILSYFQVCNGELEAEKEFNGFGDFIKSFPLERGKQDDEEDDNVVGEFKVKLTFTSLRLILLFN